MTIYLVQGNHWEVPGCPMTAYLSRASADQDAADLVTIMRADLDQKKDVTAANWQDRLKAVKRREPTADVWITELEAKP